VPEPKLFRAEGANSFNPGMRRKLALLAVAALALAGCGGGNHRATTTASAATTAAEVRSAWTRFFAPATPAAEKVKLLQNGRQFAAAVRAAAASAEAKKLSVKVVGVTTTSPAHANVVYDLFLSGKPLLVHANGVAVRTDGVWQVGEASFCKLAKLQGTRLPACTKMTP